MTKKQKTKSGFSLMEVIIAIFVLVVGLLGTVKLIGSTLRETMDTRNEAIAGGLAQEGVELVRNIRDNNMLSSLADLSQDSQAKFIASLPDSQNCVVSVGTALTCVSPDQVLYISSDVYSHNSSGTPTIFRRSISITHKYGPINGAGSFLVGADIVSRVWWGSTSNPCNLANKCVESNDYLPKRD